MKKFKSISKSRFAKNEKGNISVIAAITAPVVLMIGFGAVDYGFVVRAEQDLQAAASAAALAAVNEAEIAHKQGEDVDISVLVKETARDYFNSRLGDIKNANVSGVTIIPEIKNNIFTVDINYSATVDSTAMSIVGQDKYNISNSASAKVSVRSYMNFNFLFDVSASMGVGATDADMNIMRTAIGCAFACHLGTPRGSSTYDMSRAAGAEMRIDVARQAAESAIDVMISNTELPEHMTVGIHTYDNLLTTHLDWTDPSASNLSSAKRKLADAVQMNLEYGGTNTEYAIEELVKTLPNSGKGQTKTDRIQYIIVLTDGVEDTTHWKPGRGFKKHSKAKVNTPYKKFDVGVNLHALNSTACDGAKNKGIEVFFINTEYLVPSWIHSAASRDRFDYIENVLHDLIPQRFAECSGDIDNVVNANSPEEIKKAFEQLVGDLSTPLRLY